MTDVALYRQVHARFWMLPNLLAYFLAGSGVARVFSLCHAFLTALFCKVHVRLSGPASVSSDAAVASGARLGGWLEAGAVLGVWVVLGRAGLLASDFHHVGGFRVLAQEVLDGLPSGALLLTQGDLVTNTVPSCLLVPRPVLLPSPASFPSLLPRSRTLSLRHWCEHARAGEVPVGGGGVQTRRGCNRPASAHCPLVHSRPRPLISPRHLSPPLWPPLWSFTLSLVCACRYVGELARARAGVYVRVSRTHT